MFDPKKIKAQNIKPIVYLENLIVNRKKVMTKIGLKIHLKGRHTIQTFLQKNIILR